MNDLKEKIEKLISLLSSKQLQQDIIELDNVPSNQEILYFLEKMETYNIHFEIISDLNPGRIQEKNGSTNLWYKNLDGTWTIKLWEINRLIFNSP